MRRSTDDPLTLALRPPPDESAEARATRLAREADARRVSQAIDDQIRAERLANRKKKIVRVLLLGQSESGKSTTLRQFQRIYTPSAFRADRVHWRAIIQLNLIRSVHTVLSALASAPSSSSASRARADSHRSRSHSTRTLDSDARSYGDARSFGADSARSYGNGNGNGGGGHAPSNSLGDAAAAGVFVDMDVIDEEDADADAYLSDGDSYGARAWVPSGGSGSAGNSSGSGNGNADAVAGPSNHRHHHNHHRRGSVAHTNGGAHHHASGSVSYAHASGSGSALVNGNGHAFAWDEDADADLEQLALRLLPLRHAEALLKAKLVPPDEDEPVDLGNGAGSGSGSGVPTTAMINVRRELSVRPGRWRGLLWRATGAQRREDDEPDEAQRVLVQCREDVVRLWHSPRVRTVLAARKLRLEDESGFFLDDVERIARPDYAPTDDDVLRARLKTVGVSEYKFELEAGQRGTEWRIVDVGGSRFQRPTWAPFFDDVDAIIFLVPISAFDQVLSETPPTAPPINRLEDSVLLWRAVCANRLLARVDLVLFLNKCDLLERKLARGVPLARYVKSYGDRPNEIEAASKYFRSKFAAIQRQCSPYPRKFYGFCTSVTDTVTTSGILASVRDIVLRQNLRHVRLA